MKVPGSIWSSRGAFTLVELAVAMAVLTLLLVIVGQMLTSSQQAISVVRRLLDCADQARLAFGRMEGDFTKLVRRNDIDYIFAKQSGAGSSSGANDKIFFYSQSVGDTNGSSFGTPATVQNPVSLVGYTVALDPNVKTDIPIDLQRLGRGLNWLANGSSASDNMVFLTPSATGAPYFDVNSTLDYHWSTSGGSAYDSIGTAPTYAPSASTVDPDYHVIGDQIFRFEYCFLLKDGSYSDYPVEENSANVPAASCSCVITTSSPTTQSDSAHTFSYGGSTGPVATGTRWFDTNAGRAYICTNPAVGNATWQGLGVQDVAAIVVAIAVMDRNTRTLLISAGGANAETTLASAFVDSAVGLNGMGYVSPTEAPNPAMLILMQQEWMGQLNSTGSSSIAGKLTGTVSAATAAKIAGAVRIYQRYFYLNGGGGQ